MGHLDCARLLLHALRDAGALPPDDRRLADIEFFLGLACLRLADAPAARQHYRQALATHDGVPPVASPSSPGSPTSTGSSAVHQRRRRSSAGAHSPHHRRSRLTRMLVCRQPRPGEKIQRVSVFFESLKSQIAANYK